MSQQYQEPVRSLTKTELLNGNHIGIHKVEEPITGFKKILCACDEILSLPFGQKNTPVEKEMIAEVVIPKDATVIRPERYRDEYEIYKGYAEGPSNKLRTDNAIVKRIIHPEPIRDYFANFSKCACRSMWDNSYKYTVGKEHVPQYPFDRNVREENSSGIYFYLNKADAEKH